MNVFRGLKRISQVEVCLALAAFVVALVAGVYLAITTFVEQETCYGIRASKIVCHPLSGQTLAQTSARVMIVLSIVVVLYAAGVAAAWWQARTLQSDARTTAYMALVTCAVTVLAIALPALEGVGIFFLPGCVLLLAAAAVGLPALLGANRSVASNSTSAPTTNSSPEAGN